MSILRKAQMCKLISKLLCGETLRYLVFGVLTVIVNIAVYHVLAWKFNTLLANTIAFFVAVLLAYWTNSHFVFRVRCTRKSFTQFVSMRIGMLIIDDGGMLLLVAWNWNDLLAKCIINVVIIGLNYLISKLIIFRKE